VVRDGSGGEHGMKPSLREGRMVVMLGIQGLKRYRVLSGLEKNV
jgi:hypothetical protein